MTPTDKKRIELPIPSPFSKTGPYTFIRRNSLILLCCILLWGCSGGGGGGGGGGNTLTISYQQDTTSATSHLLSLSLNTAESTNSMAVFDMKGTGLDTTSASGISADLAINSSWMTLDSIEVDAQGADIALAAPLEAAADTVVIGFNGFNSQNGRLARIRFQVSSSGQSAPLAFSNLAYIDPNGALLPTAMSGQGGTLRN